MERHLEPITFKLFIKNRRIAQLYYEDSNNYDEEVEILMEKWDEINDYVLTNNPLTKEDFKWVSSEIEKCISQAYTIKQNLFIYHVLSEWEDLKLELKNAKKMRQDERTISHLKLSIKTQENIAKTYFKSFKKLCKLEFKSAIRNLKYNDLGSSEKQTIFQPSFYEEL